MVWYDDLCSSVRTSDVLKALDRLGGEGTLNQIEKQIIEMYKLPVRTIESDLIQEPLNILRKAGVLDYKNPKYIIMRE